LTHTFFGVVLVFRTLCIVLQQFAPCSRTFGFQSIFGIQSIVDHYLLVISFAKERVDEIASPNVCLADWQHEWATWQWFISHVTLPIGKVTACRR
jgi:hypothetical protein